MQNESQNIEYKESWGRGFKKNNRKNRITQIVCAWIPNRIDNHVVVSVLELMRKAQRLFHKDFSVNLKYNEENFKRHIEIIQKNHGYIEDQNNYADCLDHNKIRKYAVCFSYPVQTLLIADLRIHFHYRLVSPGTAS